MSRTPSPSLFHSCPGGDAGGIFCVVLLAISYLCVTALDRVTALQTLTDPNRAIKNLRSQCKGQGGSGKTHIKWLTEITMPSHSSAGHSHTNPQLHHWPAPGHTASPQTAKLISIPGLETCNRVWGGVWNSACLCKKVQNRINFLVYTKIVQEHRTEEVIRLSYIQSLLLSSDTFWTQQKIQKTNSGA